ncbi:MAG: hypothetical protein HYY24_11205 [Verrucomicrobia bacterium]|nr:hypothetical protein [Verrucomicrobiota bacterium]
MSRRRLPKPRQTVPEVKARFLSLARGLAAAYALIAWLAAAGVQAGSPIRIQCIGDSTTVGYTDNPSWSVQFDFGYRLGLYNRLVAAGYSIRYVGTSPEPWSGEYGRPRFIGSPDLRDLDQDHHRGYAWMTSDLVRSAITDWMAADHPDVILLMIGRIDFPYGTTSNVKAVQNSLSNLVEKIVTDWPQVYLIVAEITPFAAYEETLVQYNDYIRNVLAPAYAQRGKRVTSVDLYSNFLRPGGGRDAIDNTLFADGWQHANPKGNDRLAQSWFEAIHALFLKKPATLAGAPTVLPNGHFQVRFAGGPGASYQIDRATALSGPWEVGFTNLTADASGYFELEDPNPGTAPTRFYRVVSP